MDNKSIGIKTISSDFAVEKDVVIITKHTEETINKNDLRLMKRNILKRKERLKYKNSRIIDEYRKLSEEENQIDALMKDLDIEAFPEKDDDLESI